MSPREDRPEWTDTTPHPEHPALSQAEMPIGGSTLDRLLAAGAGLIFAAIATRVLLAL